MVSWSSCSWHYSYDAYVAVHGREICVTVIIWLKLLNIKHADQCSQLCHHQGITVVFLTSLVTSISYYWYRPLSAIDKLTNKVSTFDDSSHTWISYYPNLSSVWSMPEVVSHYEHIIIAGRKFIARWWHNTCIKMILKVLSWRKIPIGEKCP